MDRVKSAFAVGFTLVLTLLFYGFAAKRVSAQSGCEGFFRCCTERDVHGNCLTESGNISCYGNGETQCEETNPEDRCSWPAYSGVTFNSCGWTAPDCRCNYSFCQPDLSGSCTPPNPNFFTGEEYYDVGACTGSSTCYDVGIGGTRGCSSCPFGYGDANMGGSYFDMCVASCSGATPTPAPTGGGTPTPTPLPSCPTGFSVSCNLDGTQATVNWDDLAEAVRYVFRLNAFPTADWFNGAGGDQWLEPTPSFITVNVTPGLSHEYDIQGVRSGEVYPYSGCRAPFATFACTPPPSCSVTAPTSPSVTSLTSTSATLNWIPGSGGTTQLLRVGSNRIEVDSGCPGGAGPGLGCVIATSLLLGQSSYNTGNVLSPGTTYYWRAVTYDGGTGDYMDFGAVCRVPSSVIFTTPVVPSSCTVDLTPDTATISVGSATTLTASVTIISGTVDRVDFLSGNTGIVTVSPASDSTVVYSTQATGVSLGSTTVSADVIMNGVPTCSDSAAVGAGTTVIVTPTGPWWQVIDADVTTNGDLISPIPGTCSLPACNPVFGLKGAGGFPGVPAYGGTTADFQAGAGTGRAAEDPYNWLAASRYLGRIYDYTYFKRQIPDDVVFNELTPPVTGGTFNSGGAPSRGYVWYHWNGATLGDLTINGNVNLVGARKVVLMVEGANTTINGKIQLQNPGQGFFMVIVGKDVNGLRGDIQLTDKVDNLEGIFLAESEFRTGVVSFPLRVRGSVVAYEGISLQRDLGAGNADTPAEVFEYAPDIIATFPQVFTQRRIRWKEVAP